MRSTIPRPWCAGALAEALAEAPKRLVRSSTLCRRSTDIASIVLEAFTVPDRRRSGRDHRRERAGRAVGSRAAHVRTLSGRCRAGGGWQRGILPFASRKRTCRNRCSPCNRIVERFGLLRLCARRCSERDDLPAPLRQTLVAKLAESLTAYVTTRPGCIPTAPTHRQRGLREGDRRHRAHQASRAASVRPSLRESVTDRRPHSAGASSGNITLFEEALSNLSGVACHASRRSSTTAARAAFQALYERAGLPASAQPASARR